MFDAVGIGVVPDRGGEADAKPRTLSGRKRDCRRTARERLLPFARPLGGWCAIRIMLYYNIIGKTPPAKR
jgi:hypothetical protein